MREREANPNCFEWNWNFVFLLSRFRVFPSAVAQDKCRQSSTVQAFLTIISQKKKNPFLIVLPETVRIFFLKAKHRKSRLNGDYKQRRGRGKERERESKKKRKVYDGFWCCETLCQMLKSFIEFIALDILISSNLTLKIRIAVDEKLLLFNFVSPFNGRKELVWVEIIVMESSQIQSNN